MDALTLLRQDHREVLDILDKLAEEPGPGDATERKRLVTALVMAESAHEAIEEEYFWPSVQHWLSEGRELAAPALHQEQDAKRVLAELDKLAPTDPEFETLVTRVIRDAREHIAYEENQVWPLVRERFAAAALEELGEKMARAKKVAPTRPHPHTPPRAGVLKTAGAAAAATDKVRDIVTGRRRAAPES